jgi:photosystem II stability/assembly factor-like uncharacterized protein
MSDDTLTRLRAINPVTREPAAAPIDELRARIAAEPTRSAERGEGRGPRAGGASRRWTGALLPITGVTVALTVAVIALVTVGHGVHPRAPGQTDSGVTTAHVTPNTITARSADRLTGGMRGVVDLAGSALSSRGSAIISFTQCRPCGTHPRIADWFASSDETGLSWTVRHSPFALDYAPAFSGSETLWSQGITGQRPDGHVWVTHDGGRGGWGWANTNGSANPASRVQIAGGEVWALVGHCPTGCGYSVVHGAAARSTLAATPTQPAAHEHNVAIIAAGRLTAYVEVGSGAATRLYVTGDGGQHWHATREVCSTQIPTTVLAADGPSSLWEQCATPDHRFLLARSTDGGRHWTEHPVPGAGGLVELRPVGSGTAWATSGAGQGNVLRTTDGGVHWSVVRHNPAAALLLPVGPRIAAVATMVRRPATGHRPSRTNLMVERTTDGGRTWRLTAVELPAG